MSESASVHVPWWKKASVWVHIGETALGLVSGLGALGVGGKGVVIAGKAARVILAETEAAKAREEGGLPASDLEAGGAVPTTEGVSSPGAV